MDALADTQQQVQVIDIIVAEIESTLKIPAKQLNIDEPFENFGIDSIISMELIANLSKTLNITISPAQFVTVTTVRELADFLDDNFELSVNKNEPATTEAASDSDADMAAMLQHVKATYGIDISDQNLTNLDEITEALVNQDLDGLMSYYNLAETTVAPASNLQAAAAVNAGVSINQQSLAIVGLSCRFAGADNAQQFWSNLIAGRSAISEIPASRWDWQLHYDQTPAEGKTVSKWGALINDVDCFDCDFFGISAEEAQFIDPQLRLLMEQVYLACEDSGADIEKLKGSNTGLFVGYQYAEYEHYLRQQIDQIEQPVVYSSSSPTYYLANRLSYVFDFCGPSEAFNVNCASSAVAINRAYYSLLNGESDTAIVGGVCVNLFAGDYIAASQFGLLSNDGSCGVFDDGANGFTRGEGVAAMVLKRLADAQTNNDRIYATIKTSHQNNRGRANSISEIKHQSITDVLADCYNKAGVDPASIDYIEVDGYCTKWGDSFEFEGIRNVFHSGPDSVKHCALGSLKGNIGHPEPVSGLASVIKLALSMHHRQFPATITKKKMSGFIDIDNGYHPLYIADENIDFDDLAGYAKDQAQKPIRAGVNSFADSGANVHILLEEYQNPASARDNKSDKPQLLVFSAANSERLNDVLSQYIDYLAEPDEQQLDANLAFTLQTGRQAMSHRVAIIASSEAELKSKLQLAKDKKTSHSTSQQQGIYYGQALNSQKSNSQAQQDNGLLALINDDMAGQQLTQASTSGQWQQVALMWVNGIALDWQVLWQGRQMQLLSLPGYPFAKERHWYKGNEGNEGVKSTQSTAKPAAKPVSDSRETKETKDLALWQFSLADASKAKAENAANAMADMNDVEKATVLLQHIIAESLQQNPAELALDINLIELGLDSMAIGQLIERLNQLLQVSISPSVLFQYPSIGEFAQYLATSYQGQVEQLQAQPQPQPQPKIKIKPEQEQPAANLIPLQPKGNKTPIFAVPGADGSALSMLQLSQALGNKQPLYAFEASGLDNNSPLMTSMEQSAHTYVDALQQIQPKGPYRLLGYSNGGVMAFAMCQVLLERGETVADLNLLDSLCPNQRDYDVSSEMVALFQHLVKTLGGEAKLEEETLLAAPPEQRCELLYGIMQQHGVEMPKAQFYATYDVATNSEHCCREYVIKPLVKAVKVTLFAADNSHHVGSDDYGWNEFLAKPLQRTNIKTDHFGLIEAQAIKTVAQKISRLNVKATKTK